MLCCKCAAYNAMAAAIAIKLQHLMDEKKTESVAQQTATAVAARGNHCPSQQQSTIVTE